MLRRSLLGVAFVVLASGAARASTQERTAVLIVVADDTGLTDNLTDVAISALASLQRQEFVGSRELRTRSSTDLSVCVHELQCLFDLCRMAGARRAIVGIVDRHDDRAVVTVSLADLKQAKQDAVVSTQTSSSVDDLIAAVQEIAPTVLERLESMGPESADATAKHVTIVQSAPPPGNLVAAPAQRHERLKRSLGYSSAALAMIALSAAAVTGSMARATPVGAMRADAQRDLRQREDYAALTNYLLVGGALLATTAVLSFTW
jgi:hypothetical protein